MKPDPVDRLSAEELDRLTDSWSDSARPLSKHLDLAVAAALHRRRRNLPPLGAGEPIPGCDCPTCTGVPADAPVRGMRAPRHRPAGYRILLNVAGSGK